MIKSDCRKVFLEKRRQLTKVELQSLSWQIFEQIKKKIILEGKTISVFLPIVSKNEVDTYPILMDKNHLGYTVALPVANFENASMHHIMFESMDQLKVNSYGIPEPIYGESIDTKSIDIVFTPLLAYDVKGFRVGYGKGFYDRFISECRADCQIIGLSFFEPIANIEDIDQNDQRMTGCITPLNYHKF